MSTHEVRTVWKLGNRLFRYEEYGRDHETFFQGGTKLDVSAAKAYRGNEKLANPEDLFVAALSSCHMLSFLAIAVKRGFTVTSYEDRAVGTLAKNSDGRLAITTCVLHPEIVFAGPIDRAQLDALHEEAHHACFIASSSRTEVSVHVPPEERT